MVSKIDVQVHVINYLYSFSGLSADFILANCLTSALTNPPLNLDSTSLGFLTLSLRGYIKSLDPSQTITTAETRKPGLTVTNLIALIVLKVSAV